MEDHIPDIQEDMSLAMWLETIDNLKRNVRNLANKDFEVDLEIRDGTQKKGWNAYQVNDMYYTYLQFYENITRLINHFVQIMSTQIPKEMFATMSTSDMKRLQDACAFVSGVDQEIMCYKACLDELIESSFPLSDLHSSSRDLV